MIIEKSVISKKLYKFFQQIVLLSSTLTLLSCGGGSENSSSTSNPPVLAANVVNVASDLAVVNMTKLSETRVSRTVFDYVFSISVKNSSLSSQAGVEANVSGGGQGTTIVNSQIRVGDIGAGQTVTPTDTITIRQDRTYSFDQSALKWSFTSIAGGTTPIGYRLSGLSGSLAVNSLTDYEEITKSSEPVDTSSGLPVVRTVLGIAIKPNATVGDVNQLLDIINGTIVGSANSRSFFYVRFPDPGSLLNLESIISRIEQLPQIELVVKSIVPRLTELPRTIFPAAPDSNLLESTNHLIAIGAPAAWNARKTINVQNRPAFVIADGFGDGLPGPFLASGVVNSNRLGTVPITGDAAGHGYHVLGIALGTFDSNGPGIGDVTGAFPGINQTSTLATYIVDIQSTSTADPKFISSILLEDATILTRTYFWLNQAIKTYGRAVLNTSIGHNWSQYTLNGQDIEIYKDQVQKEAKAWAMLIRGDSLKNESSLEGKYFHAASAGNDYDVISRGDARLAPLGDSKYNYPFSRVGAAPLNELGFPTFRNVAVVESRDLDRTIAPPFFKSGAISNFSNRKGTIAAVGCLNSSNALGIFSVISPPLRLTDRMCGTSQSSPAVAGIAAYLWTIRPDLTSFDINLRLTNNGNGTDFAPVIDAYAAVLTADQGEAASGAPVRLAILDVTGDGFFKEDDLIAFKEKYSGPTVGQNGPDYSRYDLNGDGFTGGPSVKRFNLNMNLNSDQASTYESVSRNLGSTVVAFDENSLTDTQILCYYGYGPLYSGTSPPGAIIGQLCGSQPGATLRVDDNVAGWSGFPTTINLTSLVPKSVANFQVSGSNCQETGGPIFSSVVPSDANLYAALIVTGMPMRIGGPFVNRNNCSSFVAIRPVVNPTNISEIKTRVWINGTGRGVRFGTATLDWEYQIRFDSGDPFTGVGKRCEVGVVPNSGNFVKDADANSCSYTLNF